MGGKQPGQLENIVAIEYSPKASSRNWMMQVYFELSSLKSWNFGFIFLIHTNDNILHEMTNADLWKLYCIHYFKVIDYLASRFGRSVTASSRHVMLVRHGCPLPYSMFETGARTRAESIS